MVSTVVTELHALIEDSLQTVTYKFVSKRFNLPYDESKQILYEYQTNNAQNVLTTYLLSGYDADERHVVKVVEHSKLEEEKRKMSKIEGLHVYSVQPKSLRSIGNLHEIDLGQSRDSLGSGVAAEYAALGRVERQEILKRKPMGGAPTRPVKTTMKEDKPVEKTKRSFMIESDDEEVKAPGSVPPKKFKTYINENGEEVTEMSVPSATVPAQEPTAIKEEQNKKPLPSTVPKKVSKQKGIASFFAKK